MAETPEKGSDQGILSLDHPLLASIKKHAIEAGHGAKFAVFDALGGPVDLANAGLSVIGQDHPEPVLGSDYLINRYSDLLERIGIDYRKPTGSPAEEAGRLIAGLFTAAGALKNIPKEVVDKAKEIAGKKRVNWDKLESEEKGRLLAEAHAEINKLKSQIKRRGEDIRIPPRKNAAPSADEFMHSSPERRRRYMSDLEADPEAFLELLDEIEKKNPLPKMKQGGFAAVENRGLDFSLFAEAIHAPSSSGSARRYG